MINPVVSKRVQRAAAATLPAPVLAVDGVDITPWKVGPMGYFYAVVALNASASANVTDPKLYGYGPFGASGTEQWFFIGNLNDGNAIALTTTIGFAQVIQLPSAMTRLAVGGTPSAGNIGYTFTPVSED